MSDKNDLTEIVEHNGEKYHRIDPDTIDLAKMTQIRKVTGIWAYQVVEGEEVEVVTRSGGNEETTNTAHAGDWVVYNIGNSFGNTIEERMKNADMKVISDWAFKKLYRLKKDSDYSDYDSIRGSEYEYAGKSIYAARVPFNFFIHAPWGCDQFIKKGGYIIYNTNTSSEEKKDIYGTAGEKDGHSGQLSNTYTIVGDGNEERIRDVYKHVIMADRSPISGIQFNSVDLQKAYARIGIETKKWEHKF